jgi:hypothetical protein
VQGILREGVIGTEGVITSQQSATPEGYFVAVSLFFAESATKTVLVCGRLAHFKEHGISLSIVQRSRLL